MKLLKAALVCFVLFAGSVVVTHWVLPAVVRFVGMVLTQNVGG